jgi:hypothetical protein
MKTNLILADFRNLLPREVLYDLLADFSIIESNELSINIHLVTTISNGYWDYSKGYVRYNYDEISVTHTEYIGRLLGLYFNGLKSFLDKLLVTLGDGIQASRARCHLKKKIKLRE